MQSKANHKQNEKTTTHRIEDICKWSDWQKISLQSIQTTHSALYQKKKKIDRERKHNQKVGRRFK